jgi:hypothetical protein
VCVCVCVEGVGSHRQVAVGLCVRAFVRACMRVCIDICVCVCVCVCVRVYRRLVVTGDGAWSLRSGRCARVTC